MNLPAYKDLFLTHLEKRVKTKEPQNLYEPVSYILQLGGKRIRPILALLSAEAFGAKAEQALDVALAVEVFHNFTLLHDDIMDEASIRRGKPTVHKKWNVNTGILSGDVMLINAYEYLESYEPTIFKDLVKVFSQTAKEVCEGQQYDMDFETQNNVSIISYMNMITYKTSVLLAASLVMGAIVAGADKDDRQDIYDFGIHLGVAFQLQDDYLDTFGDAATFGKRIGGDILENKKTWLYIKAIEVASETDKKELLNCYSATNTLSDKDKIEKVTNLFRNMAINVLLQQQIANYSHKAIDILESLAIAEKPKMILKNLVLSLEKRNV